MEEKRGISPVIATVLLVALVIVLALLIFLWARSFVGESLEKTVGDESQSIRQACGNIKLDISYSGGQVQISNNGNIPVYKFNVRKKKGGSTTVEKFDKHIRIGSSVSASLSGSGYDSVEVVPVVMGKTSEGERKMKTCEKAFS